VYGAAPVAIKRRELARPFSGVLGGSVRELTTAEKLRDLMAALGREARGPGRVFLTGGATAVLIGWRPTTKDVDLKLDPEPPGVFEAIRLLKDRLAINVELAAPDQFIPPVPGWEDRSIFIGEEGGVEFYHYDPYGQALAKIERGHAQDRADVRQMVAAGLIEPSRLRASFAEIEPDLVRYPAVDPESFRRRLDEMLTILDDHMDNGSHVGR